MEFMNGIHSQEINAIVRGSSKPGSSQGEVKPAEGRSCAPELAGDIPWVCTYTWVGAQLPFLDSTPRSPLPDSTPWSPLLDSAL